MSTNRRGFLQAFPALAALFTGVAASRAGAHISIDSDSPFFGGVLATRGVKEVLLNGEPVRKCVEASEPDGFVIQNVHQLSGTTHLLREPGAVFIAAANGRPPRVKRFGNVEIVFRDDIA